MSSKPVWDDGGPSSKIVTENGVGQTH
jgi:hypothetical protein